MADKNKSMLFAEWLFDNRWFNFDKASGKWSYTFEQGTAMSKASYEKNYKKTTEQLYAMFENELIHLK